MDIGFLRHSIALVRKRNPNEKIISIAQQMLENRQKLIIVEMVKS